MSLFTTVVFLTSLHVVEGIPANQLPSMRSYCNALPETSSTAERSQYDIIRSCIITMIVCAWTSGHPNIAAPLDAGWKHSTRRLVMMVYALLVPERIIIWAIRQNIAADRIANNYNRAFRTQAASADDVGFWTYLMGCYADIKRIMEEWLTDLHDSQILRLEGQPWTKTHGLFIQMGGFVLYSNGTPVRVLSFRDFKELRRTWMIDDPLVTERELKDRTKSNTLSTTLAILQTTWFVFQCAARLSASLPLTKLEVITLGVVVPNAVLYIVWWNKPQDVLAAIAVPLKNYPPTSSVAEWNGSDEELDNILSADQSTGEGSSHSQQRMPGSMSNQDSDNTRPANIFYRCAAVLLQPVEEMSSCRIILPGAHRVPDFYADDNAYECTVAYAIASVFVVVFGAVSFLALEPELPNPSPFESFLWPLSSVTILSDGLTMLVLALLRSRREGRQAPPLVRTVLPQRFIVLGTVFQICARITMIIIALASLRALPPDAFKIMSWTSFIPHL